MVKEYVKKNWTLLSAGEANGNYYSREELSKGVKNTVWDKNNLSIFMDHSPYETGTWVGRVENPHMEGNDLKGDLYFYDLNLINKLEAKAEFGISPELVGKEVDGNVTDITFQNFSVVFEPACKTTYLNSKNNEKEILIEQAITPEKGYFYFVDSDGNVCQRKLQKIQNRGYVNMVDKTKLEDEKIDETETKDANKTTETVESKIESMLSEILESQKSITKRLDDLESKEEPETKQEEKEDKPEGDTESKDETEEPEEKPEEAKLSADMYEALREVNPDYAEFVRNYVREHSTEGTLVELMEKSSIEFKENRKTLEDEDKKQELQDNKVTVSQPEGDEEKKEISLRDVDMELAEALMAQQSGLAAGSL